MASIPERLRVTGVTDDTRLGDIDIDSLDMVEIRVRLEEAFGVDLNPEAEYLSEDRTVGEYVDLIVKQLVEGETSSP